MCIHIQRERGRVTGTGIYHLNRSDVSADLPPCSPRTSTRSDTTEKLHHHHLKVKKKGWREKRKKKNCSCFFFTFFALFCFCICASTHTYIFTYIKKRVVRLFFLSPYRKAGCARDTLFPFFFSFSFVWPS